MIFISADDNGHEFTFVRGDAVEISLPATSGTGYTWQAEPVAGGSVKQMGEPEFRRDSAMPGAAGLQVFHFAVGASGSRHARAALPAAVGEERAGGPRLQD